MEPGGIYLPVFHKNTHRGGAADKIQNQLGWLEEIHTVSWRNLLQSTVQRIKYDQLGEKSGHKQNMVKLKKLLQIYLQKAEAIQKSDGKKL